MLVLNFKTTGLKTLNKEDLKAVRLGVNTKGNWFVGVLFKDNGGYTYDIIEFEDYEAAKKLAEFLAAELTDDVSLTALAAKNGKVFNPVECYNFKEV